MKNIAKTLFAGVLSAGLFASAETLVDFTLSLDTSVDPGADYDQFHEADRGFQSTYAIGFEIQIHSINGTNVNVAPVAAFCSELQESISATSYTFEARDMFELAVGQAGDPKTASSNIPEGGIGRQRAAYVNYLFDQFYLSGALDQWTYTQEMPMTHAFQLALWELTHDDDFSIVDTDGEIFIGDQTSGSDTEQAQRDNAIDYAQIMLNQVQDADVSESYSSQKFAIWALIDVGEDGTAGRQDVVLASAKDSATYEAISPLMPTGAVPEPATHALILIAGGAFFFGRRVFSRG